MELIDLTSAVIKLSSEIRKPGVDLDALYQQLEDLKQATLRELRILEAADRGIKLVDSKPPVT